MKKVTTWQTASGEKIDICKVCEKSLSGDWPRNDRGEEFCQVSHGLHDGECDTCREFIDLSDVAD
jgi:hypothetical protein